MSKNLKVLFFTATYSNGGGSERVLTVLANNLPNNWDVDILEVLAFNAKKETISPRIHVLPYLTWHGCRTQFARLLIFVMTHHPQIIKAFRRLYGYDVVIGWMAVEGVSILPAFPECKTIAWFHNSPTYLKDVYSEDNVGYYRKNRLFNIVKKSCKSADSLVGVSRMSVRSIVDVYPEYAKKTHIIYNGTDVEELKKMSEEKIKDAKLTSLYEKLVEDSPVLMCIGHICTRKNFSLAVRSLAILKKKGIHCNLVIIGAPFAGEEQELQTTIRECNMQNSVFLFGAQKNPLPFLAHAKLLLMTSIDEGFPTVVTEAMALGVPFVTTPVEGASDELSNGNECGLVSNWDDEEYASCIEKLLKDKELYNKMSQNCKRHIKNYSIENYVNSLQKLINNIPQKKRIKEKQMNIVVATFLFILYSSFYATYGLPKTSYFAKASLANLKTHFGFLSMAKFCFGLALFSLNVLCFPPILLYCSILVVKYRKRLFG